MTTTKVVRTRTRADRELNRNDLLTKDKNP